jgi:hypothetical protein
VAICYVQAVIPNEAKRFRRDQIAQRQVPGITKPPADGTAWVR